MSRQLVCVIVLLQFHACFASRGLVFLHDKLLNLHKQELLGSKEEKANSHMQGLALNCRMKMEHCMEAMEGTKGPLEGEAERVKTTAVLGTDSKFEKQKKKRTLQEMKIVEARATLESSTSHGYNEANESAKSEEPGEDIEVKDYAQPQRKPPIHNERP